MKRAFILMALMIVSAAAAAQDNWFFPAPGKVNCYTTTVKSSSGSQTMYSKIRSAAGANAITVTSEVFTSAADAAPAQTSSVKYNITDDAYVIDFSDAISSIMGSMQDVDMTESSGEMIYPKNPENGKNYGTATMSFSASMMGMEINIDAQVKDRAVTAAETVEVPAGKFECLKFEETVEVELMGQPVQTKTTSWISRGVGVVKQTTDSMNGSVTVTMELTSVE